MRSLSIWLAVALPLALAAIVYLTWKPLPDSESAPRIMEADGRTAISGPEDKPSSRSDRDQEIKEMKERAVRMKKDTNPESVDALKLRRSVALVRKSGEADERSEAERELKAVLERFRKVQGLETEDTLVTWRWFPETQQSLGKFDEAENEFRELMKVHSKLLPQNWMGLIIAREGVAACRFAQGLRPGRQSGAPVLVERRRSPMHPTHNKRADETLAKYEAALAAGSK